MIQLWKKLSRCFRSRASVTIVVAVTLLLMLHGLPSKPSHEMSGVPLDGIPAGPLSLADKPTNISKPKSHTTTHKPVTTTKNEKVIYRSPLVNGKHVNPYPFRFTMVPQGCSDEELVIVVHSAAQYFVRRALMRSTWLNRRNLKKELALKTKTVFVIGKTLNESVQHHINYEQDMYDDMVQSDFIDSYQNNTYKAISFMRWVSSKNGCPDALMVLKVDDDALLHPAKIPKLNKTIHRALDTNSTDIYLGRMLTKDVNRNNASKWCVTWELWPHKLYPVWFQGLAYLLTPQLAAKLPEIALDVKYMFTDDVYVGVLVSQVEEAEVIIDEMFGIHTEGPLDKFLQLFLDYGRIFYHVPSISHFISWYYVDSEYIHFDPLPPTPTPTSKFRGIVSQLPSNHPWQVVSILIILIIIIIIPVSTCICCYYNECDVT